MGVLNWKSLFALASASVLTVGVSACASPHAKNSAGTKNTASTKTGSGQPIKMNMFAGTSSSNGNMNTNWFTKYAEKKFNMKINWTVVPSSDVQTKQSILLASGNYPDIFLGGSFSNAQLLKYGQQGIFIPLNSLLKKYAPNTWHGIENTPALKTSVFAPNGKIYGLPFYNYCLHCDFSAKYWVYKPFLQKYHLSLPRTTTQFEHMLAVFKQHGIIPLTGSTNGWHSNPITFLMNSFIYDGGALNGKNQLYINNQGKLAFAPAQPQWKQGLEYMHNLASKGLIDSAALTQTNTVLDKQAINHKVGVVPWGCMSCVLGSGHASDTVNWETVPPLTGPSGKHYAAFFGNGVSGAVFAITNKANLKEKIAMMKLLNFMWTPKGTMIWDFGPRGKYWNDAKKGQIGLKGTKASYTVNWNQPSPFTWGWNQLGPGEQSRTWRNSIAINPPFAKDGSGSQALLQYYTEKDYIGNQPKEVVPASLWIKPSEAQQYSQLQTNIQNYIKQWTSEFIVGNKSISKYWGTYVSGLKALGLNKYLSMTKSAMGKPFDTSGFKKDPSDVKTLKSMK